MILLVGHDARAEPDSVEARGDERREEIDEAPPPLRFEPTLRVSVERFDERTSRLELSPDMELHLTGAWRSTDGNVHPRDHGDARTRAWRGTAGGSYDLGWARVGASATYNQVETELGRGANVDVEIGITRTFRLSPGTSGFLSLSLGNVRWRGAPVPGELDRTQLMLRAGLRWR